MFFRIIFTLIFSIFFAGSLYAESNVNIRFNEFLSSLKATIELDKQGGYQTNPKFDNLSNGMMFEVFRLKGEIKHPITGASMGRQRVKVADAVVIDGKLRFDEKEPLQQGDEITLKMPFTIDIDFNTLDKNIVNEITLDINKNSLVNISKVSDYKFNCVRDNVTNDINCTLTHGNDTLLKSNFEANDISLTPILFFDKVNNSDSRIKLDRDIHSVAVGNIYGKDKGASLLVADKKTVYIYKIYDNLTVQEVSTISGFSEIISVEVVDVNGNGIDEIFISNITDKSSVGSSSIYEYDGKSLALKSSKLEYLFRSYYSHGKKSLLAQTFLNHEFAGLIGVYGYVDGAYKVVSDISGSLGGKVYGSSISFAGDYSYIDKAGNFAIRLGDGKVAVSEQVYGDSNKHIFYSKEKIVGSRANPTGGEMPITEFFTVAYPIYQRIIEIDRNKFFLSENIPLGKSVDDNDKFKGGVFGVYLISLSAKAGDLDVYDYVKPITSDTAIVESDITAINNNEYIFSLINQSEERYNTSSDSFISVFKLTK